ncbi:uncharacterized protein LOC122655130 [Telopea speciosissima]|uniref:uncharacterized protein LOC122655130 n=1 Tax=Telopea speciosissima TaxID=54955 RepID=UPI001CC6244E|nr:uncharacterized protein LOC122655130 [Telopea speciosissima]
MAVSFTAVVARSSVQEVLLIPLKAPKMHMGAPAVFFFEEEISQSENFLQFALVSKCTQGRPPLFEVKRTLQADFHLAVDVLVSSLDSRHLLLLFMLQSDFIRLWLKEQTYIKGYPFRFFKWTREFKVGFEAFVVPIWVSFPNLPVNLYQGNFFKLVAGAVGKVLKVDGATTVVSRTIAARACVEIDLKSCLSEKVWIGYGASGFFQQVVYERLPAYCTGYSKLGYCVEQCRRRSTGIQKEGVQGVNLLQPGAGKLVEGVAETCDAPAVVDGV